MDYETAAAAGLAVGNAVRGGLCPIVTAHHRRVLQQFVGTAKCKPAAELPGTAGVRHEIERKDSTRKLGLQNLDRRYVQIAQMGRECGSAVIALSAAVCRTEDF